MGLFDFFRSKPQSKARRSFEGLCYDMAYFVLPPIAHGNIEQVHQLFTKSPDFAGGFLFFSAGRRHGMEMGALEDGGRFKAHHGKLDSRREYYALEFPTPPPFDKNEMILAPHFAAIVRDLDAQKTDYFILGQGIDPGTTTLRSVSADGMNANLGAGPEPKLEMFLDALRRKN